MKKLIVLTVLTLTANVIYAQNQNNNSSAPPSKSSTAIPANSTSSTVDLKKALDQEAQEWKSKKANSSDPQGYQIPTQQIIQGDPSKSASTNRAKIVSKQNNFDVKPNTNPSGTSSK